jgi:hypothetical protein
LIATDQPRYFQQDSPNHLLVYNHNEKFTLLKFAASLMAQAGASSRVMPHAALSSLCRIPNYAESLVSELRGQAFDRSPCGIFPIQRRLLRRAEGMRTIIDSKHL